jgi:hypothetical protein
VRWWLKGSHLAASATSETARAIRTFFSTLDAASVIASCFVQSRLDTWRVVADDLPALSQSEIFIADDAARRDVLRQWIEVQDDFHTAAKHELGIKGQIAFLRRAYALAAVATILLLLSVPLLYLSYPAE